MVGLAAPTDLRAAHVISHGRTFLASDPLGDVSEPNPAALGLYLGDTRFLSRLELTFDGTRPLLLHSTDEQNYAQTVHATVSPTDGGSLAITRHLQLAGSLFERIAIANPGSRPRALRARMSFAADYRRATDIRESGRDGGQQGQIQPVVVDRTTVTFACLGIDGAIRRTTLRFSPAPARLTEECAEFQLAIEAGGVIELGVEVTPELGEEAAVRRSSRDARQELEHEYTRWRKQCSRFRSTDQHLAGLLDRSVADIRMLQWQDRAGGWWLHAGLPWFPVPMSRDSIIAAYQFLGVNPELAWMVLRGLAALQGSVEDPASGEEPGRIPDEVAPELAPELAHEVPGTASERSRAAVFRGVDATSLWLVLLTYAYAWTGDLESVRELWPNAVAALEWIDRGGDRDGDGYVEDRPRPAGGPVPDVLDDPFATVVHPDGRPAEGAPARVEAQGHVYQAKSRLVRLARVLGHEQLASRLVAEAEALADRFNADFWLADEGFFARALDGDKRPVRTATSHPGMCLWAGIVEGDRVARVARRLVSPTFSSGWGVRGLGGRQAAFDPLGRYTGSVWPGETALIAHGLKARGFDIEAMRVLDQLLSAGAHFALGRYPELFCGHAREDVPVPVVHPAACRPHATAAGVAPLVLRSSLGLTADAPNGRLYVVRPQLPYGVGRVDVLGMRVGEARIDITFSSVDGMTAVHVSRKEGPLDVLIRQ